MYRPGCRQERACLSYRRSCHLCIFRRPYKCGSVVGERMIHSNLRTSDRSVDGRTVICAPIALGSEVFHVSEDDIVRAVLQKRTRALVGDLFQPKCAWTVATSVCGAVLSFRREYGRVFQRRRKRCPWYDGVVQRAEMTASLARRVVSAVVVWSGRR